MYRLCQSKWSNGQQLHDELMYLQVATQLLFHMLNHTILKSWILFSCKAEYYRYAYRLLSVRYLTDEVGHEPVVPFQGGRKIQHGGNKHKKTWIPKFPALASKRQPSLTQCAPLTEWNPPINKGTVSVTDSVWYSVLANTKLWHS
jgi:hypothetical protein